MCVKNRRMAEAKPAAQKRTDIPSLGAAIAQLDSEKTDKVLEALMAIRKKFLKVMSCPHHRELKTEKNFHFLTAFYLLMEELQS